MKTHTGVLVNWDVPKGFGFIREIGKDGLVTQYFLHASQIIKGEPAIGAKVAFEVGEKTRGTASPALAAEFGPTTATEPKTAVPTLESIGGGR
jgi:cold shock CspA family protein